MASFSDSPVKRPFSNALPPAHTSRTTDPLPFTEQSTAQARVTRPLEYPAGCLADTPTSPMPRQTSPLTPQLPLPSTHPLPPAYKPPLVIHAEKKRSPGSVKQRRGSRILVGSIVGSLLVLLLTTLLVSPLANSQHGQNLAQSVNNWFTFGQTGAFNPSQNPVTPTATAALRTNEGYCGGTDIWGTCATLVTASGVMGTGQMQRPIIGAVITQPFAHPEYQYWCGCWRPHTGIDLAAPYGTPIMAADSGQVIWTGWDWSGLGWAVKINHGNYIATIYGHMERFIVSVGQNVTKGQVIGYEGSTGASTGPHVHFMVMVNNIWVNPILYVQLP